MRARLADPAREKPPVAVRQRPLDLLEGAALLCEREPERLPVVEEDVDPDPWVRACDTGHVAQGAARSLERIVAVDPRRARLVEEHVRKHVRQVARQADEPVVRVRPDRDGSRAERADEAVQQPQPLRRRRRRRGKEPRRAVEELRRGAAGAARLGAADRVAADEPRVRRGRRADRALRRADVGDRAPFGCPVKDFSHGVREIADRRSHHDEIRVRHGCGDGRGGQHCPALTCERRALRRPGPSPSPCRRRHGAPRDRRMPQSAPSRRSPGSRPAWCSRP